MARQADVVVPIYGNVEVTRRCVEGVLERSGDALARVILIDDASPDPAIAQLLAELRTRDPRVVAVRNQENLGFVGSANRGLALRERDVVLLNSDTLPTDGWLQELLEVAYSRPDVAAVTPLSNNGTLCSVPRFCEAAPFDEALKQAARWEELERSSVLPTGVGFCLLMRDAVLNLVGNFDSAFGRGYNEENDWCMRAAQRGQVVLRANRALVLHEGSTSFSDERHALEEQNSRLLRQRYPFYRPLTRLFDESPESRIAARFAQTAHAPISVEHRGLRSVQPEGARPPPAQSNGASSPVNPSAGAQLLHRWGAPALEDLDSDLPYVVTWTTSFTQDSMFNHGDFARHQRDRATAFAALSAAQAVIFPSHWAARTVLRELGLSDLHHHVLPPTLPRPTPTTPSTTPSFRGEMGKAPFHNRALLLTAQALAGCKVLPTETPGDAVAFIDLSSGNVQGEQLLQALVNGTPVITTRDGSATEWLGDAALYVERGTAEELAELMSRLLTDGVLRQTLVRRSAERVAHWPKPDTLERIYREVLARSDPASRARRRWLRALCQPSRAR